jgi:hypothetical protein
MPLLLLIAKREMTICHAICRNNSMVLMWLVNQHETLKLI